MTSFESISTALCLRGILQGTIFTRRRTFWNTAISIFKVGGVTLTGMLHRIEQLNLKILGAVWSVEQICGRIYPLDGLVIFLSLMKLFRAPCYDKEFISRYCFQTLVIKTLRKAFKIQIRLNGHKFESTPSLLLLSKEKHTTLNIIVAKARRRNTESSEVFLLHWWEILAICSMLFKLSLY